MAIRARFIESKLLEIAGKCAAQFVLDATGWITIRDAVGKYDITRILGITLTADGDSSVIELGKMLANNLCKIPKCIRKSCSKVDNLIANS